MQWCKLQERCYYDDAEYMNSGIRKAINERSEEQIMSVRCHRCFFMLNQLVAVATRLELLERVVLREGPTQPHTLFVQNGLPCPHSGHVTAVVCFTWSS